MMQINNFKRLEEEGEHVYIERHEERVKEGIIQSLSAFRMVGYVLDIYLPKIFSLFVVAVGGREPTRIYHPHSTPPSDVMDERKPGSPSDNRIIR
jgi:hypothetical protein